MKFDVNRSDAWYLAISEFLEANSGDEDARMPGTLVSALCRVLSDAMEGVDSDPQKKIEAVARLTAQAMGLRDPIVIIKYPTDELN